MHVEKERSYIFKLEDIYNLTQLFPLYSSTSIKTDVIEDCYLNKNLRLRKKNNAIPVMEYKSNGKKEDGRTEESHEISDNWFNLLKEKSILKVIKKRQILHTEPDDYIITLDIVSEPMRILILEIESLNGNDLPELKDFFPNPEPKFITCPLSAWDYFKRKIAICGAPSSGKTSTAQWITNKINTEFGGKAFCPTEYATSFIQKYDRIPNIHDQYMIWECQNTREANVLDKCDMVISDSPTFLSYVYGLLTSKDININDKHILLSKLYKRSLEGLCNYEQIFFLNLLEYKENGIRYNTKGEAIEISEMISNFLRQHGVYMDAHYTYEYKEQILSSILYLNEI